MDIQTRNERDYLTIKLRYSTDPLSIVHQKQIPQHPPLICAKINALCKSNGPDSAVGFLNVGIYENS